MMKRTARLIAVLVVVASCEWEAASQTTPPAVVALARAGHDDSSSELATGLALEAGHWLVNRNDIVVRMLNDPGAYAKASFAEVNNRLAIDLVIWIDARGTAAQPVVSYVMETSSGEAGQAKIFSDGLSVIPRSITENVLSYLKLRTTNAPLPAWSMPAAPAYDAYVRALGRAHTKAKTEAERVALFEKVAAGTETYPRIRT